MFGGRASGGVRFCRQTIFKTPKGSPVEAYLASSHRTIQPLIAARVISAAGGSRGNTEQARQTTGLSGQPAALRALDGGLARSAAAVRAAGRRWLPLFWRKPSTTCPPRATSSSAWEPIPNCAGCAAGIAPRRCPPKPLSRALSPHSPPPVCPRKSTPRWSNKHSSRTSSSTSRATPPPSTRASACPQSRPQRRVLPAPKSRPSTLPTRLPKAGTGADRAAESSRQNARLPNNEGRACNASNT